MAPRKTSKKHPTKADLEHSPDIFACRKANSRLPISTLSDDVLGHIFLIYMTTQEGFPLEARKIALYMSQVCHRWRDVAIGYYALWCDIDLQLCSPEWVEELLHRSGNAPLTIRTNPFDGETQLSNKYLSRLGRLYATISPSSIVNTWTKVLTRLTSQTDTLNIQCYPTHWKSSLVHLPIPTTAGLKRFVQQSPLKTLALGGCITDLESPLFSNLSVLCIVLRRSASPISAWAWLDILKAIPKLVYLDLEYAIHRSDKDNDIECAQPSRMVQLPFLRSFRLVEFTTAGGILFVHTVLPSSCLLEISLRGSKLNAHLCNNIITQYGQNFVHTFAKGRSRCLRIGLYPKFFFSNDESNISWGVETKKQGFSFLVIDCCGIEQHVRLLSLLGDVLPSVTTLFLNLHQIQDLLPFLRKCTGVTSLEMGQGGQIPDVVENALFPSLKVLIFSDRETELQRGVMDLLRSRNAPGNNFAAIECIRYTLSGGGEPMSLYSFLSDTVRALCELGVRIESVKEQQ